MIEEFGRVGEGDVFGVGEQTYELVVWPEGMTNLRSKTAEMLEEYLARGGILFGVRPDDVTVDGRPADFLRDLEERYPGRCQWFDTTGELIRGVSERIPPRMSFAEPPATGLAHMRRLLSDSELFIVVNSSSRAIDGPFAVETGRHNVYEMDPGSGACHTLETTRDGNRLTGALKIEARRATVLWATDEDVPTMSRPHGELRVEGVSVDLELKGAGRAEPNVLVVDHCELEIGGKLFAPEAVYAANERLWKAHGMDTNGWMAVIQYRDQILARNEVMAPDSGGVAHYRFHISDDLNAEGARLGLETPELWRAEVNGHPVNFTDGERWLDDHIRAVEIGGFLRGGENVVRLEGRPFDVRREIDQIYLLGEFACREATTGFSLEPARPLNLGSWRTQGCPFYDRTVSYDFELPDAARGVLSLDEEDWRGSLIVVEQEGKVMTQIQEPPYRVSLDASLGRNLTLRVVGLPKNLLGPWHDPARQRGRAWIPMWYGPDIPKTPRPGNEYDLLDLGLLSPPQWTASK